MNKALIAVIALMLFLGSFASIATAHGSGHFHCSKCGSHDHGSMWHDSDKDGVDDR